MKKRGLLAKLTSIITVALSVALSGCALDVDLSATPAVHPGDEVDFAVKVTSQFSCPVGLVTVLVIPFIPKGTLTNHIQDPEIREKAEKFVDDFCTGDQFEIPPDADARCYRESETQDLICEIDVGTTIEFPIVPEETLSDMAGDNMDVTCQADGEKITCRIPQGLLEVASETIQEQNADGLGCTPLGPLVLCGTLELGAQEMKFGEFDLIAESSGVFRHLAIAFPLVAGGVCRNGLLVGHACDEDDSCLGFSVDCAPGLCTGGANDGKGCDPAEAATHCPDGMCNECEKSPDGRLLTGVACATTKVGEFAPAMSMWTIAVTALMLLAVTVFLLRRRRSRGNI